MAKLLTPFCMDALPRFHNCSPALPCSGHRGLGFAGYGHSCTRRRYLRVTVLGVESASDKGIADGYYSVLGLVALMLSGMGASSDVFRMASSRWQKRQSKVLEKARIRMMKQKGSDVTESWTDLWGKPKDYKNTDEEAKERARRATAAARRWREYSRRGIDRPPTLKLPEALANKD